MEETINRWDYFFNYSGLLMDESLNERNTSST
jgi:hypothetical protein